MTPFRPSAVCVVIVLGAGSFLSGCSAQPAPAASPTSAVALPGEPRLLFEWYPPNASMKTQYISWADAQGAVAVTTSVAPGTDHVHSDWSPDGTRIAFEALSPDGPDSIWIADADGSNPVESIVCESDSCLQQAYPSFSPDGRSIVFIEADWVDNTWGPASIVTIDLDTGARRVIAATPDGLSAYYSPRWSRDGSQIVAQFETYPDPDESSILSSEIVIMPADGSAAPVSLTDPAMFAGHPDWSPTDDLIVFDTYDLSAFFPISPGDSNLYVMRPDGSELRQVTTTTLATLSRIGEPTWTPGGSRIVATRTPLSPSDKGIRDALIVFVDPDTGKITETGIEGAEVRMQPMGAS